MTQKLINLIKKTEFILNSKAIPYVKYSGGNILICISKGENHYMMIMFNDIEPAVKSNLRFFSVRETGILKTLGQVVHQLEDYLWKE